MSKREASFHKKYGPVAGAIIFRLLCLHMGDHRW